ncbi:MAG: DnaB-like helicase C-terminal domain-containing protein, partial [Oscillospiraceae bacterium]
MSGNFEPQENMDIMNADFKIDKMVPFSNEAEQAVLGSMFLDRTCIPDVVSRVHAEDFYIERHRELFEAVVELYNLGHPLDLVTLKEHLILRGTLESVGGIKVIVEVANQVPSTDSVRYYAQIVTDKALLRRLISMSDNISGKCYRGDEEIQDILGSAQQGLIDITQGRVSRGLVHISKYLNDGIEQIERLSKEDSSITGIPTGFRDIDNRTAGLHPSELIVLAARPGMGKTSFALNIAENAAIKAGKKVAIFSLEMPGIQLANRLLCSQSKISSDKIKKGKMGDGDWEKLGEAVE